MEIVDAPWCSAPPQSSRPTPGTPGGEDARSLSSSQSAADARRPDDPRPGSHGALIISTSPNRCADHLHLWPGLTGETPRFSQARPRNRVGLVSAATTAGTSAATTAGTSAATTAGTSFRAD